jgi:hypothetical protein
MTLYDTVRISSANKVTDVLLISKLELQVFIVSVFSQNIGEKPMLSNSVSNATRDIARVIVVIVFSRGAVSYLALAFFIVPGKFLAVTSEIDIFSVRRVLNFQRVLVVKDH